jgi:3'-phosphoadenosine 5'-phosphosulfate sulfotransferase (PAPS reductase)/FAD synthetase
MTHIIKKEWANCPIIVQFDDCDWPEKRNYINRICERMNWRINEAIPDFSIWKYAKQQKIGDIEFCSKNNFLTKEGFLKPLYKIKKKLNCEGSFIGLRKEESNRRKRNQKYNGNIYTLKSGEIICTPIIHFNVKAVFAYLVSNDIEINPCYFNNAFQEPEEIRLSWFLPTISGYSGGWGEYMRKYYPQLYSKFREINIFT